MLLDVASAFVVRIINIFFFLFCFFSVQQQFELLVLNRLQWDLSAVTPLDFLELLLIRLPILSTKCPDLTIDRVRLHAQAFISLGAKGELFLLFSLE